MTARPVLPEAIGRLCDPSPNGPGEGVVQLLHRPVVAVCAYARDELVRDRVGSLGHVLWSELIEGNLDLDVDVVECEAG